MTGSSFSHRFLLGLRTGGVRWAVGAIFNRLFPPRPAMRAAVLEATDAGMGLEIGGPSRVFSARGLFPIYPSATHIDNVNFAAQTTWESELQDGGDFRFDPRRAPGTQFIREATTLSGIGDGHYDFVLSSHCLEHVANPLGALREWHRVTRPGGCIVLILPDPTRSFDRRRPVTTLAHLENDSVLNTGENDTTHIPEVLAFHDLSRDPWAGSREMFEQRVRHNPENRCIHHHVFDLPLLVSALNTTGWQVIAAERVRPVHLCAFARKP
jgi:SAM-dependent methyltransferase